MKKNASNAKIDQIVCGNNFPFREQQTERNHSSHRWRRQWWFEGHGNTCPLKKKMSPTAKFPPSPIGYSSSQRSETWDLIFNPTTVNYGPWIHHSVGLSLSVQGGITSLKGGNYPPCPLRRSDEGESSLSPVLCLIHCWTLTVLGSSLGSVLPSLM